MKASERLRELEREAERLAAERDYDLQLYHDVVDALPLIADVVEAAELLVTEAQELHSPEYPSTLKSYRASHTALTALRDALEGGNDA